MVITVISPSSFVISESTSLSSTSIAGGYRYSIVSPTIDNSTVIYRALSYSVIVVIILILALLRF